MKFKSFRKIINLSSYLDKKLSPSQIAKIDEELKKDQQSQEILTQMQQVKFLLKKAPVHKVPKNFILSPKMVGMKPPVSQPVRFFRMASVTAALVFIFSFAVTNVYPSAIAPMLSANVPMAYGIGGGGGGCGYDNPADCPPEPESAQANGLGGGPAATEAPLMSAQLAPGVDNGTEIPPESPTEGDTLRATEPSTIENPAPKVGNQDQPNQLFQLNTFQLILIGISVLLIVLVIIIRQYRTIKWRKRL